MCSSRCLATKERSGQCCLTLAYVRGLRQATCLSPRGRVWQARRDGSPQRWCSTLLGLYDPLYCLFHPPLSGSHFNLNLLSMSNNILKSMSFLLVYSMWYMVFSQSFIFFYYMTFISRHSKWTYFRLVVCTTTCWHKENTHLALFLTGSQISYLENSSKNLL